MMAIKKTIDWANEDELVSARVAAYLLDRAIQDAMEVALVLSEDLAGTRALDHALARLEKAGYEVEREGKQTRIVKFDRTVAILDHSNGMKSFIDQYLFGDLALALRAAAKGGRR